MTRAMIVAAAGSGSRFETDKMMALIGGVPLVMITLDRVCNDVSQCVLVCREEQMDGLRRLGVTHPMVSGGPTRTSSETAGLEALAGKPDLIAIHDGARPNPSPHLVRRLFETAAITGGAVPVVAARGPLVDRTGLGLIEGVMAAQTPQVFHGPTLVECYRMARETGYVGLDTMDVVTRFSDIEVAAVPGERTNIKVTYPSDLASVIPLGMQPL